MNLECAAGGSAWKRPIVGNQKCLFQFSGSSYHFGEKKGKLRASLDSPGNSCTMRPRRVPSHEEAMNLVRSGTKQPQWIFFSAEDKARHFCICTIRLGQNIRFRRRISVSVQFPSLSPQAIAPAVKFC